jgi:RNA polymerase sigma-70 factor (ECF subfamily)
VFEDDLILAHAMIGGDRAALRQFSDQYLQRLAAFVQRRVGRTAVAVEDIVQGAAIRALRALPQYRGEASLFTWLCQIASSELADQRRRLQRRITTVSLESDAQAARIVDAMPMPPDCPGGTPELTDGDSLVADALASIPPRYARVLEWKYGDEASVEEIARLTGQTPVAAQSLLARARDAFRDAWSARRSASVSGDSRPHARGGS